MERGLGAGSRAQNSISVSCSISIIITAFATTISHTPMERWQGTPQMLPPSCLVRKPLRAVQNHMGQRIIMSLVSIPKSFSLSPSEALGDFPRALNLC